MESASVDGIEMRWAEHGQGVPLVLIHGIPTCPALWRHVVPRLSGARCLAWEMVATAARFRKDAVATFRFFAQAEYLTNWLRSLGIERAVFAGHDLGGGVARIVAVRHPELCQGLFLTNSIDYDLWPIASVKAMRAAGPAVRHLPQAVFKQVVRTFSQDWNCDDTRRRGHRQRVAHHAPPRVGAILCPI